MEFIFDGKYLKFRNKTKYYLQIKSVSMYYNGLITTTSVDYELPPEAQNTEYGASDAFVNYGFS